MGRPRSLRDGGRHARWTAAAAHRHVSRNQRAYLRPGARWHAGSLVLFARSRRVARLVDGTRRIRASLLLGRHVDRSRAPGDRRRVALRLHPPVAPPPHDRRGAAVPSQCRSHRDTHRRWRRLGLRTLPHVTLGALFPFPEHGRGARVHRLCPCRSRTLASFSWRTSRTRRRTPRRCRAPQADR